MSTPKVAAYEAILALRKQIVALHDSQVARAQSLVEKNAGSVHDLEQSQIAHHSAAIDAHQAEIAVICAREEAKLPAISG